MSCEKILVYHPLLQWYIDHGLIVTKVHSMIHCKKNGNVFNLLINLLVMKEEKEMKILIINGLVKKCKMLEIVDMVEHQ